MTNTDIVMTIAVIVGPIIAVLVTRLIDDIRSKKDRRLWIFRAMMKDRGDRLSNDFVAAFNLVEIEFYGEDKVIQSWKDYHSSLHKKIEINDLKDIDNKLAALLSEMAKVLGYKNMDKLDILNNSYIPKGWQNNVDKINKLHDMLIKVLNNEGSLSVILKKDHKDSK